MLAPVANPSQHIVPSPVPWLVLVGSNRAEALKCLLRYLFVTTTQYLVLLVLPSVNLSRALPCPWLLLDHTACLQLFPHCTPSQVLCVREGDMLLDLLAGVDPVPILTGCAARGVRYLNAASEVRVLCSCWQPYLLSLACTWD